MNYDKASIIFVVERSLPMKLYIPEMIDSYISPALNNFCGGLNEDSDVFFKQGSPVQFGVVFFSSEALFGNNGGQLYTVGPTPSIKDVLSAIRGASYTCQNQTRQASIIEGLNSASVFFTQLDKIMAVRTAAASNNSNNNNGSNSNSDSTTSKKFCILVTQSVPFHHPWAPATLDQTVKNLKMSGVKLSILGCHKLGELYRVFETSGGDLNAATHKNYAKRPHHLVLLSGFTLPEHDNLAIGSHSSNANTSNITGQTTAAANQQQPSPAGGGQVNVSPQQQQASNAATASGNVGSPASHHQQQQQNAQQQIRSSVGGMPQQSNMPTQSQGMSVMNRGNMMRPTGVASMQTRPRWQNPIQGNQQQQQQQQQDGIAGKNTQQMNPSQLQQQQNQQQVPQNQQQPLSIPSGVGNAQRSVVWQGTLELQDPKKENMMGRNSHQVPCKMTTPLVNGEPEVKTDGWPVNLVLQLIPKTILSCLGNSYFKHVHTVMFLPEPCPALTILTNNLSRSMAGCIYPSNSNVRMIILLFSAEKKAYVGFIPIDQQSFIAKMKNIINLQRSGGSMSRPGVPAIAGIAGSGQAGTQMGSMGVGGLQVNNGMGGGGVMGSSGGAMGSSGGAMGSSGGAMGSSGGAMGSSGGTMGSSGGAMGSSGGAMGSSGGAMGSSGAAMGSSGAAMGSSGGAMGSSGGAMGSSGGAMSGGGTMTGGSLSGGVVMSTGGSMSGGGAIAGGGAVMGGGGAMVGSSVVTNQLTRPGAGMTGLQQQQQQQQQDQPQYQVRLPQVVQGTGMRGQVSSSLGAAQQGVGRGVIPPQLGGGQAGSQRMMSMLQQQQMQQQQQQQQQQMLMMQQQGMRPNMGQAGMPQGAMGQGTMGQGGMGQVGMGQAMGQPGMGGALPPESQDFMDML